MLPLCVTVHKCCVYVCVCVCVCMCVCVCVCMCVCVCVQVMCSRICTVLFAQRIHMHKGV